MRRPLGINRLACAVVLAAPIVARADDVVTIVPGSGSGVRAGPSGSASFTTIPTSGVVSGSAADGSTATTRYDLTQRSFQFAFEHQLSGQSGSYIQTNGAMTFTTTADLLFNISAQYSVTQQLWSSGPPELSIYVQYSNPPLAQDPFVLTMSHSVNGSAVALDYSYQSGFESVGPLTPGQNYDLGFSAGMYANAAGSAATAAGSLTIHLNLWGDFNDDGSVGFDDLLTLAQHYGVAGPDATYANGCMNADASIAFDDLLLLAQHYGEEFPSAPPSVSAVPDPTLLGPELALAALSARHRPAKRK